SFDFDPTFATRDQGEPMAEESKLDEQSAHKHFAASCFNRAWELIEKLDRTPDEEEEMIRLSHASHWHWTQVKGHTPSNLSIGYWQLARVYALAGEAENARRYGRRSLEVSRDEGPFCLGYARESLARAEVLAGNASAAEEHLQEAFRLAEQIKEAEEKSLLLADLNSLASDNESGASGA
ncbi:MAG: tetratricopeptide repeat protein, partial [Planctomycetales bacterium]